MQFLIIADEFKDSSHVLEDWPRFRALIPLGAEYVIVASRR